MKVIDLDGNKTQWKISASPKAKKRLSKSEYHKLACSIIHTLYPTYIICEEVPIKIQNKLWLYLDIYLPTINMAIEVQGEQHYKFSPFFHKTKLDFLKQRKNDRLKKEWCEINSIAIVCLKYNETIEEWKNHILNYKY